MATIRAGYRIKHPTYGEGVVQTEVPDKEDEQLNDVTVEVHFTETREVETLSYDEIMIGCTVIAPEDEKLQVGGVVKHSDPTLDVGVVVAKKCISQPVETKQGVMALLVPHVTVEFYNKKKLNFVYSEKLEQKFSIVHSPKNEKSRSRKTSSKTEKVSLERLDRVVHPQYGTGVVTEVTKDSVTVNFGKLGVKKLVYSYVAENCEIIKYSQLPPAERKKLDVEAAGGVPVVAGDFIYHIIYGRGYVTRVAKNRVEANFGRNGVHSMGYAFASLKCKITKPADPITEDLNVPIENGDVVVHPKYGKGVVDRSTPKYVEAYYGKIGSKNLKQSYVREKCEIIKPVDGRILTLETDDSIKHPEYGYGQITEVKGDKVKVHFTDAGYKTLEYSFAAKRCIVTKYDTGGYSTPLKNLDDIQERARQITDYGWVPPGEDEIQVIIRERFSRYSLDERSLNEVKKFLTFKLNYERGHKKPTRYNLLIQCENDSVAVRLIREIVETMKDFSIHIKNEKVITERSLMDSRLSYISEGIDSGSVLVIHNGTYTPKVSFNDLDSSHYEREEAARARKHKDEAWSYLIHECKRYPDCTVIAAGPRSFIDYVRERDDLYYRFLTHHIIVGSPTEENVTETLYRMMASEKLKLTDGFREGIEEYIKTVYPKADLKGAEFVDDLMNRILEKFYLKPCEELTEEYVPFYRKQRSFEDISKELNGLVGLKRVKKQFEILHKLNQDPKKVNKTRLHFAFVGNPGTGKTTVAELTAELLHSMGLIRRSKVVTVVRQDVVGVYLGQSGQLMQEKINEALGGVLFIDEAYFLISNTSDTKSFERQCLEVLLQQMEARSDELTVIFAGYPREIEMLLKSNAGMASRVPYIFHFDDYTKDELIEIFKRLAAQEEITLAEDAVEVLERKIMLEMSEEDFGNARSVASIYQQIKSAWAEREAKQRVFTAEDIMATMPVIADDSLFEEVGLDTIRDKLYAFQSKVRYMKFLKGKGMSLPSANLHMLFIGNPGSGKTKAAEVIADCLFHAEIIKTNKIVKAERKDLIADNPGGTAIKTNKLIKKALGGVLFIDEAYSLYQGSGSQDLGLEAIATLITAMESYKDELVVIFAGYRNEMMHFLSANPGISSRIGWTFDFPDFSPEQLTNMFCHKMIDKYGFSVDDKAKEKVYEVMRFFSRMEDFGNGRFVTKVIGIVIENRSYRSYKKKYNDITAKDIPDIRALLNIMPNGRFLITDEEQTDSMKRRTAIHEAGHALVSKVLAPNISIPLVNINPDGGGSLGRTSINMGRENNTETDLKAQLAVGFGGRNAERLVFGSHSAGCISDIRSAKGLAVHMIEDLAMGEFGVTSPRDLLKEADGIATAVLSEHRDKLELIADVLCEKESIEEKELDKLLGKDIASKRSQV